MFIIFAQIDVQMARPIHYRKVQIPPRVKGFVPIGYYSGVSEPIVLQIEEFEAIRLLDYENLSQSGAASYMEISRPTLTRIYERARRKIAASLTEVHPLTIEGGKVIYQGDWYECPGCSSRFNNPTGEPVCCCPLCASDRVDHMESVTL